MEDTAWSYRASSTAITISGGNTMSYESKVLTISGLISFLSEIEQLKGLDMQVSEQDDGWTISIGEDTYKLESYSEVEVDNDVVDSIEEIDEEGWEDVPDVVEEEPVEGGIIKELLKTLAIGGLVRLTKNAIQKG